MRHLISLKEQSREDLLTILNLAQKLKAKRKVGESVDILHNKTLIMLFQKTSTRTRLSFEAAMTELGGHAIFLDSRTSQFSLTDFGDEIRAVMRYGQVLMFRALKAADVIQAASYNQIPVIDACSEKYHPAQALGDILTMIEHSNGLENIKKITPLENGEPKVAFADAFKIDGYKDFLDTLSLRAEVEYEEDGCEEIQLCLAQLKDINIRHRRTSISKEIKSAEEQKDSEKVNKLIKEFNLIN